MLVSVCGKQINKNQKLKYIKLILQLLSTMFHILKLLQNIFINSMSYIPFNVHSQTIIHILISHLIDLFKKF